MQHQQKKRKRRTNHHLPHISFRRNKFVQEDHLRRQKRPTTSHRRYQNHHGSEEESINWKLGSAKQTAIDHRKDPTKPTLSSCKLFTVSASQHQQQHSR